MEDNGNALIDWDKDCKPKKREGLGILDISTHNKALLVKFLFKFMNQEDVPRVKLIWERYYNTSIPTDHLEGSF